MCVGGQVVDWICSEMHFELMEANSCLTLLQSDVVVGENGPGRNVKRSADSPSAPGPGSVALFLSVCLLICSYLFLSVSVGPGAHWFDKQNQVHVRQSEEFFLNQQVKLDLENFST